MEKIDFKVFPFFFFFLTKLICELKIEEKIKEKKRIQGASFAKMNENKNSRKSKEGCIYHSNQINYVK